MKNTILSAIPFILILIGLWMAFGMIRQNSGVNAQNNFYTRFQTCILSVKPSARTDDTIHKCYERVEKETGIKAPRYELQGYDK